MINVICVKHGNKYHSDYVNKLYNMVMRHLTIPHNFICFTEDSSGIDKNISIKELPDYPITGWWWKTYIFKSDHFSKNDINLFFDLDMVIIDNIDHFINYLPTDFVGLRDLRRVFTPEIQKLGSAVLKWPAGEYSDIWERFVSDYSALNYHRGDQDWIWHLHSSSIKFFPDDWIRSYKWEIRSRSELNGFGPNTTFKSISNPYVSPNTSVLAFHGFPSLSDVKDPIIVDNWK